MSALGSVSLTPTIGTPDRVARSLIESVIEFRDTQVGQIMSARPEIVGLCQRILADLKRRSSEG